MEDVSIFKTIMIVYFTANWYILWPFGTFCGHLVHFLPVLVCCGEKNLAALAWKLLRARARSLPENLLSGFGNS
jgi:ABC-type spermidine/putrescine transport system permease subunit II